MLLTDDPTAAVRRAETRDAITYTSEQWRIHHRAADLFERLAAADPAHVRTIDRRDHDTATIIETVSTWIDGVPRRPWDPE